MKEIQKIERIKYFEDFDLSFNDFLKYTTKIISETDKVNNIKKKLGTQKLTMVWIIDIGLVVFEKFSQKKWKC